MSIKDDSYWEEPPYLDQVVKMLKNYPHRSVLVELGRMLDDMNKRLRQLEKESKGYKDSEF